MRKMMRSKKMKIRKMAVAAATIVAIGAPVSVPANLAKGSVITFDNSAGDQKVLVAVAKKKKAVKRKKAAPKRKKAAPKRKKAAPKRG